VVEERCDLLLSGSSCGGVTVTDSVPDFSSNWLGANGISSFFDLKTSPFNRSG